MYEGLTLVERVEQIKLTKTEEACIEKILARIQEVVFYNGAELAVVCGVSASLITRLIQKLGYDSFNDFKKELKDLYNENITPYDTFQKHLADNNDSGSVIHRSIVCDVQNIIGIEEYNSEKVFEEIIDAFFRAKRIYIVAMFASEAPARTLAHYLDRLSIKHCDLYGLGISKKIEYWKPEEGDLVVALSSQGILREVHDSCSFAKKQGAEILAITDSKINALARLANYTLIAPVEGAVFDYSHVATLALINVLANKLADRLDPQVLAGYFAEVRARWMESELFINNLSKK